MRNAEILEKYRNNKPLPIKPDYLATLSAKSMDSLSESHLFAMICTELTMYKDSNNVNEISWEDFKEYFLINIPSTHSDVDLTKPEEVFVLTHYRTLACKLFVSHVFYDNADKIMEESGFKKEMNNNGGNA